MARARCWDPSGTSTFAPEVSNLPGRLAPSFSSHMAQTLSVKTLSPQPPPGSDKSHHLPNGRGFVNPWPSWSKPSLYDFWSGLSWYGQDGSKVAEQVEQGELSKVDQRENSSATGSASWSNHLTIEKPDFGSTSTSNAQVRTWWLGHAGTLIELPSRSKKPFRVLFDPIFSQRCSPSQYAGPLRFVPSPVSAADLPDVHVVVISHNHYDHLDAETIAQIWQRNQNHLRIFVPLGNREWMQSLLGPGSADSVHEMDWWDQFAVWHDPGEQALGSGEKSSRRTSKATASDKEWGSGQEHLRITCTPAQHGSGRFGLDTGSSLWASYTLRYYLADSRKPFHIYFAGDTGYRLRSPALDPAQPSATPPCPAFREIHGQFGSPDLLLLPISVGSTYSYLKSWDPVGILPQVDGGLTAQNHLDEWEAVEVARVLTGQNTSDSPRTSEDQEETAQKLEPSRKDLSSKRRPLAIAIHFGTFAPPQETRGNLTRLLKACARQRWRPLRALTDVADDTTDGDFLVLNHGQCAQIPFDGL